MKHVKKFIALIFSLCIVLGAFSGCGSDEQQLGSYKDARPKNFTNLKTGVVASNDNYTMSWDKDLCRVSFEDKEGNVWSTIPESFLENPMYRQDAAGNDLPEGQYDTVAMEVEGETASAVVIECRNAEQSFTYNSLTSCLNKKATFTSKKAEGKNGISVTFYFDEVESVVTVDFYLEGDSFKVSVDPGKILCYGENIVTSVTPAPALCATDVLNTLLEGQEIDVEEEEETVDDETLEGELTDDETLEGEPTYDETLEGELIDGEATDGELTDGEVPEEEPVVEEDEEVMKLPVPLREAGYGYIVVPSGSGALMYCNTRNNFVPRKYSAMVYGEDLSIDRLEDKESSVPATMPFFGVKRVSTSYEDNGAICAIIEQAEDACNINAEIRPFSGYYGKINAAYNVTGYNNVYNTGRWRVQYNDSVEKNVEPLVIGYYSLAEGENNYTGMAKKYKEYLTKKQGMTKSRDNALLTVKLIGGYEEDDLFLGIPTTKDVSLTSYEEARKIVEELNEMSGGSLVVDMYGYGSGGINANELAGGYTLTGAMGDEDALKEFLEYTKDKNISAFFNFDTVVFYESGNGYSISDDSAVNVNGVPAPLRQFWYSIRTRYETKDGGKNGALLSRDRLGEAVSDVVELADEYGITGLAFDTLGNTTYSDYVDDDNDLPKYPIKSGMGDQVAGIIKDTKASSKTVLIDGANAYAAAGADIISGCPTASNMDSGFDLEVPLYQIVFQGTKSNSVYAINMCANQNTQFLKAIETGAGLSFTLMANYEGELRKQYMRGLGGTVYSDNKARIAEYIERSKAFLTDVSGAEITAHEYLEDDVVKTTFSNNVSVIVNYGDSDYESEFGVVKANDFLYR